MSLKRLMSLFLCALSPLTAAAGSLYPMEGGDLRTLPSHWAHKGGMDGFYAARLVRNA